MPSINQGINQLNKQINLNPTQKSLILAGGQTGNVTSLPIIAASDIRPASVPNRPGSTQLGKSAFDWDVFKNRRTALQYLRRQRFGIDTILETEDGSSYELVHSQVISAFGDKLNNYIRENGVFVESYKSLSFEKGNRISSISPPQSTSSATKNAVILPSTSGVKKPIASIAARKTLSSSRWPGRVKLIRLPKVNKYTIGILVDCAYSGYIRTDLPSGGIWQVLEMADYYDMFEVIRACCAFLVKSLDKSNCIKFYHVGIKYKHHLQRCAWHKIRANFKHILARNLKSMNIRADPFFAEITVGSASANSNDRPPSSAQRYELTDLDDSLATISFEHFEPLLMNDKLNIDNEECLWFAIQLWCNFNIVERGVKVISLLPCMRFPRFKTGTEFSARYIWRDPLISENKQAQQQLAILDRNHRDFLTGHDYIIPRDGFHLPASLSPRQLRPRIPHSILLAIGGWQQGHPTTLIESYDSNCNLWFECKKRIMSQLAYHGVEYINGVLYICGGTDGTEILNEMFTFDPIRGDCTQKPSMRESRCYVSTAYLGGFLYAMGGHNGVQRMRSVERFDLDNEVWTHIREMNVARSDASACVHESLIYIAGGLNEQVIESSVEFYNHQDNSWTFLTSMNTPRTSFTLILYHGVLLAIGGNNGNERLSSVEQYNFTTKSWSHHSDMRHRRSTFSAALLDEDKLIVVGGYNGQTPFNQVEMYDGRWVTLQKIRYDRSGLKAIVICDLPNASDYTFHGNFQSLTGHN